MFAFRNSSRERLTFGNTQHSYGSLKLIGIGRPPLGLPYPYVSGDGDKSGGDSIVNA